MSSTISTGAPGYAPDFLSVSVALPAFAPDRVVRELNYIHFTVLLDPLRRLPAATGVNVDGTALVDVPRVDKWAFDPRVPESEQAGDSLYSNNYLDRGHQVRRRDPVWGAQAVAANIDTFVFTNAAPQASIFNQGKQLWVGLEDHVLAYAEATRQRISVFTGPVLDADDPVYRGIGIPRLFWKVVAWVAQPSAESGGMLRTAGFVLDQSPYLEGSALAEAQRTAAEADDPPPLGPFRTFQVAVSVVASLTGLDLEQLAAADVMPSPPPETPPGPRAGWRPLAHVGDVEIR